jgi:anti-sigma regulatory factor (Ser/Thr protein kinase)
MHVELDPGPTAAAEARAALTVLDGRVAREILDDLRLLVSELVTNSVRHSGAPPTATVELQVVSHPSRVRVEVSDRGSGFEPRPRTADQEVGSGWGLHLVDQIADRWGVDASGRKRVWFEIAA